MALTSLSAGSHRPNRWRCCALRRSDTIGQSTSLAAARHTDADRWIEGARRINYGSFTNGLRLPELTEVLQLNERIDQIEKNLPFHLKCDNPAKGSTPRDRLLNLQAEAVITRYTFRLILLRPVNIDEV